MEIKIIQDKYQWDNWHAQKTKITPFAQSWAWGDILISEGKKVERLAVVESGQVIAQAQVVYTRILFGWQYAFCPKGPVVTFKDQYDKSDIYKQFVDYLRSKSAIFFRIEPQAIEIEYVLDRSQKTIDINPSATLLLNLQKTEAQLFGDMHQKTRYNIRLAEKKNLRISHEKNFEAFWGLMTKTGSRDKFDLHHKKHYLRVLASPAVYQLTAYADKIPVACAVFVVFGNTFSYLYGASDHDYRNLMAPYLLQWEGMHMGQDMGCNWYDFFGVAPIILSSDVPPKYIYDDKNQYAGVTRFKIGFGGTPYQDPGTFDVITSRTKYRIYSFLRKLRRLF